MESMEAHVGKMETQLKQWGAKLDELVAKADEASAEAKIDYHRRIDELRARHQTAQAKLKEVKEAGSEKWHNFRAGVESAWNELEIAFKELKS